MKTSSISGCGLGLIFALAASPSVLAASVRTIPDLGLDLVAIPAGTFTMGTPASEAGRTAREGPQTEVTISRPFWLGKYEVTHGQWKKLMGTDLVEQARRTLADETPYLLGGKNQTVRERLGLKQDSQPAELLHNTDDNLPMHWVNWEEAADFCRRLTGRERAAGRLPAGYEYRLPTEAEWEYACRAGSKDATYAGPMEIKGKNNAPALDAIAWYAGNSTVGYRGRGMDMAKVPERQHPGATAGARAVGGKQPNAWGLYDMLGNVWEWCGDWYADKLPGGSVRDPVRPPSGKLRVFHGGGWYSPPVFCRSGFRDGRSPVFYSFNLGFRVALAPRLDR